MIKEQTSYYEKILELTNKSCYKGLKILQIHTKKK